MKLFHQIHISLDIQSLRRKGIVSFLGLGLLLGSGSIALAVIAPDVQSTRHNLSVNNTIPNNPSGASFGTTVKATSETQVCVFCHTPHAATSGAATGVVAPLWNRNLSTATYTPYSSGSMDASPAPSSSPGVGSKLCLSCHDGTIAIGTVGVLNNAPGNIAMQGTDAGGTMTSGNRGATTGFTRRIGTDLSNDHPISFTYDSAQATRDGELITPGGSAAVAQRTRTVRPVFPLIGTTGAAGNQLECITCHDPHLADSTGINNKFLRANRFQRSGTGPVEGSFNVNNDIMCLACHNKKGWSGSAHENRSVATNQFTSAAANIRDFPTNLQVTQAACLACHDTHTVSGARRLLREGTDSGSSPKVGGNAAAEQVCFQCHSPSGASILTSVTSVPNIRDDFSLSVHMPIVSNQQGSVPGGNGTNEVHNVTDGDLIETQALLGNLSSRHAECTDCHNPHRLTKTHLFNDNTQTTTGNTGTHDHVGNHTNIASGVLRGSWGVEPNYSSASFYSEPNSFTVKKGPAAAGASTAVGSSWVTREYQICAKCHSNYAFGNLSGTIANPNNIPRLGRSGGTPSGTNGLMFYTNVFREIQAPTAHQGEGAASGGGATFTTNNHRSWHPVMGPTGRTPGVRNASASNWLAPFNTGVGTLTMYCTDCHGSNTANGVSSQAADGPPEGPHGSQNVFLLKGPWSSTTGTGNAGDLCFKCHDYQIYANGSTAGTSGFGGPGGMCGGAGGGGGMGGGGGGGAMCMMGGGMGGGALASNLHAVHQQVIGRVRCTWCHIAIPHGWKNKALLVNLNDVGPEADCRSADTNDAVSCTVGQAIPAGRPLLQQCHAQDRQLCHKWQLEPWRLWLSRCSGQRGNLCRMDGKCQ